MVSISSEDRLAEGVAKALVDGFDRHYQRFRNASALAKLRFERAQWHEGQQAVKERLQFYDERVRETVARLRGECNADHLADRVWRDAKLYFVGLLINRKHKQPELAETFFNSVYCRIRHRTYFHNDFIFVRPALSTEYIESEPPTYRCYYPDQSGLRAILARVFIDFGWTSEFEDLERDIGYVAKAIREHFKDTGLPPREANLQLQVLSSPFYRNKGAYIIGRALNGGSEHPFTVPVLHSPNGKLYLDTVILDGGTIATLFSLSRAYFMVDMEVPSGYVQFLRSIMPNKPRSELYTMLGLAKQGKTMFFRDLIFHLHNSADQFILAPGIPGLVMLVFTLPSYPYVFKVIKDVFGASKEVDHETVRRKYQLVKQVDRVGRMADTWEFSYVALPRRRFSPELIDALYQLVPSLIEEDGDEIIIKHLYIERRMEPLNLYLDKQERAVDDKALEQAVIEYGNAIRELAIANIFPGDMLWKNFGITRYKRVVFYDYDEIEYMTDCHFRRIPPAPDFETEMSGEVWYPVAKGDIFPEEFRTFLLSSSKVRAFFLCHHADLLEVEFWQKAQDEIRKGVVRDFFPYPEEIRFCNAFLSSAESASV
ncbi:MAG TPA: bifunctional isocitrate dehydrogenase kinase/phosphatase [Rhodocyclaceae bacterium]|nr:bifunctional isocitrate dehydrogenase kinase/phosphatase [Rhodocyclaceae bacterium]